MAIGSDSYDPTDAGIDYGYVPTDTGANFNISIPVGAIQVGSPGAVAAGPTVSAPSVPRYPSTAPPIYQAAGGAYPVQPGPFAGQSGMLWIIILAAVAYVVLK